MVLVVFLLMAGTCGACWYFKTHQKIGKPGVLLEAGNIYNEKNEIVRTNRVALPEKLDGYTSRLQPISTRELNWLPADTLYGRRLYATPDESYAANVTVVLMEKDRTSIHRPQFCLPANGFDIFKEESIDLPIPLQDGTELKAQLIQANRVIKTDDGQTHQVRALYIYYFVADGQTTNNHAEMLWRISKDLLSTGVTERWGYVSLFTLCMPGQEAATLEQSKDLLKKMVPTFQPFAKS